MKTTTKPKRKAGVTRASTRTARKAASAPRAKKHHILANAATQRISSIPRLPVSLSSFNPALPLDGSLIIAGELRNQFNGLVVMIDSIPAGPPGPQGEQGIQGPPFAQAVIDGVTTLAPGTPAWVTVGYYNSEVHFAFGIPTGDAGQQGPPGEVTNAQMTTAIANAISGTSNNTNAVATMDTPFANDPPTLADMELMRAKYNELVLAARR